MGSNPQADTETGDPFQREPAEARQGICQNLIQRKTATFDVLHDEDSRGLLRD